MDLFVRVILGILMAITIATGIVIILSLAIGLAPVAITITLFGIIIIVIRYGAEGA